MDIKNIKEVIEGLKVLALAGKKIAADGKVNLADLPALVSMLKDYGVIAKAIEGIDQVVPEFKDLDSKEVEEIVALVLAAVAEIKAA